MTVFSNLDLFSVGVAVAATAILGFVVYFNNRKSVTHRAFLNFSIVTSLWGVVNYAQYHAGTPEIQFWLLKTVLFFALLQAYSLFQLFYAFPAEKFEFSKFSQYFIRPLVIVTAFLTLTPLVFRRIGAIDNSGQIVRIINGPGIILFGIVSIGLVISAFAYLFKKSFTTSHSNDLRSARTILGGAIVMFLLIIGFNFIFPAFLNNPRYIPLGAVFILPFVLASSYVLGKHHLLGVKVVATEVVTFLLAIISVFEVVFAESLGERIFRVGIFVLILGFGLLLIRSVRKEVEQRELLEKLNKELEARKSQLEELSRFKTQLLSLVSHQIKAPLATIKGFISILIEGIYGKIDNPKIIETLGKMKNSADEDLDLIDTLLDLRRIEAGKIEYKFTRVNLVKITREVIEGLEPLATQKNIKLESELPDAEVIVNADPQKLKQVIRNLIENAIKYTPQGFVRVLMDRFKDEVMISVKDSGLGMSKELIPNLFQEFIRDERVKKQIRGTGLGLYIAKRMLEAHGGTIWAESEGEGKGSTFSIKLKKL